MKKINYNDAKHDGETLYRFKRSSEKPETVVVMSSGYIRLIDIKPDSGMAILQNIPAGTKFGNWELKK